MRRLFSTGMVVIHETALNFGVKAKENLVRLPSLYWLPKLHTNLINSSSCTTPKLSYHCEKVNERSCKNLFWSTKQSGELLDKLKARDFNATCFSTYVFFPLVHYFTI